MLKALMGMNEYHTEYCIFTYQILSEIVSQSFNLKDQMV